MFKKFEVESGNLHFTVLTSKIGFSLIEVILVVAITLIIAGSSASFFSGFLQQNAVANTTDQFIGSLRKAQFYSMMGKADGSWGMKYTLATHTLTLFKVGTTAYDENYSVNPTVTLSANPPAAQIVFAKMTGLPSISALTTVTVSGGNKTETFTVNMQGVVSRQ